MAASARVGEESATGTSFMGGSTANMSQTLQFQPGQQSPTIQQQTHKKSTEEGKMMEDNNDNDGGNEDGSSEIKKSKVKRSGSRGSRSRAIGSKKSLISLAEVTESIKIEPHSQNVQPIILYNMPPAMNSAHMWQSSGSVRFFRQGAGNHT